MQGSTEWQTYKHDKHAERLVLYIRLPIWNYRLFSKYKSKLTPLADLTKTKIFGITNKHNSNEYIFLNKSIDLFIIIKKLTLNQNINITRKHNMTRKYIYMTNVWKRV